MQKTFSLLKSNRKGKEWQDGRGRRKANVSWSEHEMRGENREEQVH
jgi:hypothetical protein